MGRFASAPHPVASGCRSALQQTSAHTVLHANQSTTTPRNAPQATAEHAAEHCMHIRASHAHSSIACTFERCMHIRACHCMHARALHRTFNQCRAACLLVHPPAKLRSP